uniref:kinase D-interacting substrate of 220 kDa isoform X3 n=1 Tax=Myxine glutinosa TaxID=7769 RepID=UPI00358F82F8
MSARQKTKFELAAMVEDGPTLPMAMMANYIEQNDIDAIVGALENCQNFNERNENGQTALMLAAEQGNLEVVREMLKRGADCNIEDDDNWTALISAAKEGHIDIVRELIDRADIEHKEMGGWTALTWVAYKGHTDVACLLLEHNANPNIIGQYSMTPIMWACGRGHHDIVELLLQHEAKYNCSDKYGTTPLIWAARKGHLESVRHLLAKRADVNHVGANSLTALIVAVRGDYADVVEELLEKEPDVNLADKDGNTALMIAAKQGYTSIVSSLLEAGAYVNTPDRHGDTVLVWAVRGGHVDIVRALLAKLADVDVHCANKTALYWAVEKGNTTIVRDILECNPDTEICTQDGETPLIKATKMRSVEIVQLLLDKNAKVSASDKKGDSSLHIAIRGRGRRLAELLLRNPKDGRLLYRPNKAGETPYNIDCNHQKSILTQIFGARHLSPSEANGDMLGYDLYSSALADILSEPTMQPPICVGLYAQWGSGKSFLLKKLEDEMKTFAGQESMPLLHFSWLLMMLVLLVCSVSSLFLSVTVKISLGIAVGFSLLAFFVIFLLVVDYGGRQESEVWGWASIVSTWLAQRVDYATLLFNLVFVNPPDLPEQTCHALPVRFLFTDYSRLTSIGGETSIAEMIASLSDACEREFGFFVTRLYRVFKSDKTQGKKGVGKWKRTCCVPSVLLVLLAIVCLISILILLVLIEVADKDVPLASNGENESISGMHTAVISLAALFVSLLLCCPLTMWRAIVALLSSQRRKLISAASNLHQLHPEGFSKVLKTEVDLMARMTKTFDAFTQYQTRLVVIVDGLDTCEQGKVIQMLDMVRILFSQAPFISLFASDPQIIIKAINQNLNAVLRDSNINGHDYMRNVVHLPFFLNSRNVPASRSFTTCSQQLPSAASNGDLHTPDAGWVEDGDARPTQHRLGELTRQGSKSTLCRRETARRRTLSRQLTRQMSFDLSKLLLSEDWSSDISPQTMRRILNIVSLTGRLLRANQISFSWDRLASWINLTEQWPYRSSWIVLFLEQAENVPEHTTLKNIYERIAKKIPVSKDVEPMLEIDGDVRAFEIFLSSRSPMLTLHDIRTVLPCTINLDPKIREIIADIQAAQDQIGLPTFTSAVSNIPRSASVLSCSGRSGTSTAGPGASYFSVVPYQCGPTYYDTHQQHDAPQHPFYNRPYFPQWLYCQPTSFTGNLPQAMLCSQSKRGLFADQSNRLAPGVLSSLTVSGVCERLVHLDGVDPTLLGQYQDRIRKANIGGRVLTQCNLDELKTEMDMSFGDWQLFKSMILELRQLDGLPPSDLHSVSDVAGSSVVGGCRGGSSVAGSSIEPPSAPRDRLGRSSGLSVGGSTSSPGGVPSGPTIGLTNDKYSLNFSFEELRTAGLEDMGSQVAFWQSGRRTQDALSQRTHSTSSLNSELSVQDVMRMTERQQAEYRDAYGAYISQMAQVDGTGCGSSLKSSLVTSPESHVHFSLLSETSRVDKLRINGAVSGVRGKSCDPGLVEAEVLNPIAEEEERPGSVGRASSNRRTPGDKLGKVLHAVDLKHRCYQKLGSDDETSGSEDPDGVPLLPANKAPDVIGGMPQTVDTELDTKECSGKTVPHTVRCNLIELGSENLKEAQDEGYLARMSICSDRQSPITSDCSENSFPADVPETNAPWAQCIDTTATLSRDDSVEMLNNNRLHLGVADSGDHATGGVAGMDVSHFARPMGNSGRNKCKSQGNCNVEVAETAEAVQNRKAREDGENVL